MKCLENNEIYYRTSGEIGTQKWKLGKKQQDNGYAHRSWKYFMKIGRDALKCWLYFNWICRSIAHFLLVSIKTFKIAGFL